MTDFEETPEREKSLRSEIEHIADTDPSESDIVSLARAKLAAATEEDTDLNRTVMALSIQAGGRGLTYNAFALFMTSPNPDFFVDPVEETPASPLEWLQQGGDIGRIFEMVHEI